MSRKPQKKDAREQSTRQLMGIDDITDYGIATRMGATGVLCHQAHQHLRSAGRRRGRKDLCPAQCGQGYGGDRDAGVKFQGVL